MMGHNSNRLRQIEKELANNEGLHEHDKIKHAIKQGALLREARDLLPSNEAFGEWLRSEKFSELLDQRTAHNYRTLYDNMGDIDISVIRRIGMSRCYKLTDPALRDAVVEHASAMTEGKMTDEDIKAIEAQLYPPEPAPAPDPTPPAPAPEPEAGDVAVSEAITLEPSPKERRAAASYIDDKAAGKDVSLKDLEAEIGQTNIVARRVVAFENGYRAAARDNAIISSLSMSATQKLEAAKAREIKRLQAEFEYQVQLEVQKRMSEEMGGIIEDLKSMKKRADRIAKGGQKMNPDDYKLLKMCFHQPQNLSDEKRAKAWEIFKSLDLKPFSPEEIEKLEEARKFAEEMRRTMMANA